MSTVPFTLSVQLTNSSQVVPSISRLLGYPMRIINYPLTIREALFLAFIRDYINSSLTQPQQIALFCIDSSLMDHDFQVWVNTNHRLTTMQQFATQHFNIPNSAIQPFTTEATLDEVVSSIWQKTQFVVNHLLLLQQDQNVINEEEEWQRIATMQKGVKGKIFTAKQVDFLLQILNAIQKVNVI